MADQRHRMPQNRQKQEQRQSSVLDAEIREKMSELKNLSAKDIVFIAEEIGRKLKENGVKMTQIRKFLDGVRKIDVKFTSGEFFNEDSVILLKPKLAYVAGKHPNMKLLMDILNPAIDAANSYETFKKLVALIESIIAYHKYYGGGD